MPHGSTNPSIWPLPYLLEAVSPPLNQPKMLP